MTTQSLSSAPSKPEAHRDFWDRPWLICAGVMAIVAAWVIVGARGHTALHHDMAEQFVWAHAWQLGYPKHPPLPTWLFLLAQTALPPRPATLYGLSALCIGLTGVFTYLMAREWLRPGAALCVVGLWGLMQPFGWRAWIYNHNTVLVFTVAMTAYLASRAVRRDSQGRWALAGAAAGLALSTKLQAAVPLMGVLWALWRSDALETLAARKGAALAMVVAALVSAPPLLWMATGHTNALAYATHQLGSGEGAGETVRLGQFIASVLRMIAPALLVLLAWVLMGRRAAAAPADPALSSPDASWPKVRRAWVEGLVGVPLLFVLAMGLLGGAKLHAQWAVQTFQFLPFALVVWFETPLRRLGVGALLVPLGVMQAVSMGLAASPAGARLHAPGAVQGYPAQALADRVWRDWQKLAPGCRLDFIDAPFFEGGQMSAYLPGFPMVRQLSPRNDSPWVDERVMQARGSVVMREFASQLPADALHTPDMALTPPAQVRGVGTVTWGIRPPKAGCDKAGNPR